MSSIQKFWRDNHTVTTSDFGGAHTQCKRLTCVDGYNVSAQASEYHYSTPRAYLDTGRYLAWELGYPTQPDGLLDIYAEDPENLLQTVYGYVPTTVVDALIEKHGGLKS